MQLAKLTTHLWGCLLLLGWLLPKHLLHYVPTSAFQHAPVALAHLFPFSSVPLWEEVYRKDKSRSARCAEGSKGTYSVLFCLHSLKKQAQSSRSDIRPPWEAPCGVDGTQLHHLKELLQGQGDRAIWGNCTANFGWKEKNLPGKEIVDFNCWQQHSNVPSSFVFSAAVINWLLFKILDHE